jgi:DNA invertase Pin-like site-specific DNA recombinase
MIYGYARVSTQSQDLEGQIDELKSHGALSVYTDNFTGALADRPALNELREILQPKDRVLVTKMDRLARSLTDGNKIIKDFIENGVFVEVIQQGFVFSNETTPVQTLMRNMLFAFAEFEREMIIERTKSGRDFKKANDPTYKEGRPKRKLTKQHLDLMKQNAHGVPIRDLSLKSGINERTLYRIKKQYHEEHFD